MTIFTFVYFTIDSFSQEIRSLNVFTWDLDWNVLIILWISLRCGSRFLHHITIIKDDVDLSSCNMYEDHIPPPLVSLPLLLRDGRVPLVYVVSLRVVERPVGRLSALVRQILQPVLDRRLVLGGGLALSTLR